MWFVRLAQVDPEFADCDIVRQMHFYPRMQVLYASSIY